MVSKCFPRHLKMDRFIEIGKRNFHIGRVGYKQQLARKETDPDRETHCVFDICGIKPGTPQPAVVIVGAGMAGLSAANRLVQCGITNIKVLESMDGPGGRIKTCWLGDAGAEMGWQWIEGASLANTVFNLAAQERLFSAPLPRMPETVPVYLTAEGRPMDDYSAERGRHVFNEMRELASEQSGRGPPCLLGYLNCMMEEQLKVFPKHERRNVARVIHGILGELRAEFGQDLDKVSWSALGAQEELPGGRVRVPLGLAGLVAPLVRDLPPSAVVYCKPVHTILWGTAGPGQPRALVRCCDGEAFPADYVIVTVPLGVLKSTADQLFCPALPAGKMDAIQRLGFGNSNKIYLKFDTPFWADDGGSFVLCWEPEDIKEQKNWLKGVSSFEAVSSKVMCCSVGGADAAEMEHESDGQVVDALMGLLSRFTGSTIIPRPSEVLRSEWGRNIYFQGRRTLLGLDAGPGTVESMACPLPPDCIEVPPIIFFAGEHTHPSQFGTLHGSRKSGIREADRVVMLTRKFAGPPVKQPVCVPCQ